MYLFACQDDVRTMNFSTTTTTYILTLATLTLRGYHLYVILIDFYSGHNIHAITMLQQLDCTFDLFSSLTVCGAPAMTVRMLEYI
jgi:hypothetical protein